MIEGLPVPMASTHAPRAAADGAAEAFERVFLTRAVDEMLATAGTIFGDSEGDTIWRGVLAEAIAAELSGAGGTGVAAGVRSAISAYGGGRG